MDSWIHFVHKVSMGSLPDVTLAHGLIYTHFSSHTFQSNMPNRLNAVVLLKAAMAAFCDEFFLFVSTPVPKT